MPTSPRALRDRGTVSWAGARIHASRTTLEAASWTICVQVMLGFAVLAVAAVRHLGWSWPRA